MHFAPTQMARRALEAEGVSTDDIWVTGNTVVDALQITAAKPTALPVDISANRRVILLTAHRRESFGRPMEQIFRAAQRILHAFPDVHIIYPVHPNPNVKRLAYEMLEGRDRIHLLAPLDYRTLVACLKRCDLVLTDSGGIQEEAPALGKPVLVLRDETERPEGVAAGVAKLIGTDEEVVFDAVKSLLTNSTLYRSMAQAISPYGDGRAAARIVEAISHRLHERAPTAKKCELEYAVPGR